MRPLPIKTAAAQAGINRRTLQRWIREGCVQKLQDGKVDLDEVSNQKDYLSSARRRGPVPGRPRAKSTRGRTWSEDEIDAAIRADIRKRNAIIRRIDGIKDIVDLAFIQMHLQARLADEQAKMCGLAKSMAASISPAVNSSCPE
jgi:predicted AAA+ superfamily ATPase